MHKISEHAVLDVSLGGACGKNKNHHKLFYLSWPFQSFFVCIAVLDCSRWNQSLVWAPVELENCLRFWRIFLLHKIPRKLGFCLQKMLALTDRQRSFQDLCSSLTRNMMRLDIINDHPPEKSLRISKNFPCSNQNVHLLQVNCDWFTFRTSCPTS